ncbi:hypothetical protein RZS08_47955, partial [Arthrospira platensis SPKY1]|nr:hypothetical protein [Arthrospira platensis SPKY1]
LERLTDIKGRPIPSLNYNRVELEGREIFREAEFKQESAFYQNLQIENFTVGIYWMPLEKIFSGISEIQNFLFEKSLSGQLNPLSSLMQVNSFGDFAIDGSLAKMFW